MLMIRVKSCDPGPQAAYPSSFPAYPACSIPSTQPVYQDLPVYHTLNAEAFTEVGPFVVRMQAGGISIRATHKWRLS